MKLLYENDLIYGRLLEVSQDYLVERYRKAMVGFGLKPTKLDHFHIDMTGFSPEVADEMDDQNYLDPLGVNRRFVVLSPEQEHLPVVHTQFSNTGELMHRFFQDNERALRAITIKDALYGEIDDPIARVEDIEDILSIEEVQFEVKSADELLDKANELRGLADRLQAGENAWRNDELLERMVELAAKTGDIRHNKLVPEHLVFEQGSFWANHFGGIFIFKDDRTTTVICDSKAPGFRRSRPWQVSYIDIADHKNIFQFLTSSGRLQRPHAKWTPKSGLFDHRAEMVVWDMLAKKKTHPSFTSLSDTSIKTWLRDNRKIVSKDGRFDLYQEVAERIDDVDELALHELDAHDWLRVSRADPKHREKWLINRLLSRLEPSDFVSRFVFDKQGFYETYQGYSDEFKQVVVDVLKNSYLKDKAAWRQRFYQTEGTSEYA